MPKLCKRCGGSGWLLRNPDTMTPEQLARTAHPSGFGRRFTRCSDCTGTGVKGRKE